MTQILKSCCKKILDREFLILGKKMQKHATRVLPYLNNDQMCWKVYTPCQCASTNQYLQFNEQYLISIKSEKKRFFFIPFPNNYLGKGEMPESCCLQKVPQPGIYLCHSDQHGVIQCQIARCASGYYRQPGKEPSAVLLLVY